MSDLRRLQYSLTQKLQSDLQRLLCKYCIYSETHKPTALSGREYYDKKRTKHEAHQASHLFFCFLNKIM